MISNLDDLLAGLDELSAPDAPSDRARDGVLRDLLSQLQQLSSTAQPTASPDLARLLSSGRTIDQLAFVPAAGPSTRANTSTAPTARGAAEPVSARRSLRPSWLLGLLPAGFPGRGVRFGAKLAFAAVAAVATAVAATSAVNVPSSPISGTPGPGAPTSAGPSTRPEPTPAGSGSRARGPEGVLPLLPLLPRAAGPTRGTDGTSAASSPPAGEGQHSGQSRASDRHRGRAGQSGPANNGRADDQSDKGGPDKGSHKRDGDRGGGQAGNGTGRHRRDDGQGSGHTGSRRRDGGGKDGGSKDGGSGKNSSGKSSDGKNSSGNGGRRG
jgi:hypothetical protein